MHWLNKIDLEIESQRQYSEETLEQFRKIFAHISEFPELDPSIKK